MSTSRTSPRSQPSEGVNLEALVAEHADLAQKLKNKKNEIEQFDSHLQGLVLAKSNAERDGKAKSEQLQVLRRLHTETQNLMSSNIRSNSMIKSFFNIEAFCFAEDDENEVRIPTLDELNVRKVAYEDGLSRRKWLPALNKAKSETQSAEEEAAKLKAQYENEERLYYETEMKLKRYNDLDYIKFIVDCASCAVKSKALKKTLAGLLVKNAKLQEKNDSLEEDLELSQKKEFKEIKPSELMEINQRELKKANHGELKQNINHGGLKEANHSQPKELNHSQPKEVNHNQPKVHHGQVKESNYGSNGHKQEKCEERIDDVVGKLTQESPKNNGFGSLIQDENMGREAKQSQHDQDEEESDWPSQEEENDENEQNDSVMLIDDEQNKSDSIIYEKENDIGGESNSQEEENVNNSFNVGFNFGNDNNDSIIIDEPEKEENGFNDSVQSLSPVYLSPEKNVQKSPKSPVFAVPKVPGKRQKPKKNEPVFNLDDKSFNFNNFDPSKETSQNDELLERLIDTSQNSVDPGSDFLQLVSNSSDNDAGGFNFNLFDTADNDNNGEDQPFNFSIGSGNKDGSTTNFFGF
ncbi:unnamed protein product [Bursaphelenchus okinawaensis]|uniref:Uncharacterized protein n=1 Tax=Bursaphelenchus okinawaensis TaxID=465554 RepID=A0A811JSC6_9BILA|nr:unnamed protein product [Bursaphelenchus okinawaensis]CAG9080304.1 unnamed protein product [Bursaphelenchus okinawaensis]